MPVLSIPQERFDAALDKAMTKLFDDSRVVGNVTDALDRFSGDVREMLERAIERWLERHRDAVVERAAELIVSRLFSDPGGPSLFRGEIVEEVLEQLDIEITAPVPAS